MTLWARVLATIGPRVSAERRVEMDLGGEGVKGRGETFSFLHGDHPQQQKLLPSHNSAGPVPLRPQVRTYPTLVTGGVDDGEMETGSEPSRFTVS